jgi:hypothetical protein
VDDRPERLLGVVGGDGQPVQVVGVDLVAIRRGGLVAGRLVPERDAAVGGRPVADDEPARLVRVVGAGVGDDRVADGRRQDDRGRTRMPGRTQARTGLTTS